MISDQRSKPALLVRGSILTLDPANPGAEAMVVENGRIVFVGDLFVARSAFAGRPLVERHALGLVMPGLIDSHLHMLGYAMQRQLLDLSGCECIDDLLGRVSNYAADHPDVPWIVSGEGWHVDDLRERRYPSKEELDAACSERPVYLPRVYHAAACNSKALAIAGIERNARSPEGGRIELDSSGEPTGVLLESPAFGLVAKHRPAVSQKQKCDALIRAQRELHKLGLTGITDPGLEAEDIHVYQAVWSTGDLSMRSVVMPLGVSQSPECASQRLGSIGIKSGFGDEMLRIGGVKLFLDGGATLGTAMMRRPHLTAKCGCGIQVTPTETLKHLVRFCVDQGWSLGIHTVGGAAIDLALDSFAQAADAQTISQLRFSLIHAYLWPNAKNMERARMLDVSVACQPAMQYQFAPALSKRFGDDPIGLATPLRSWIDSGVRVAGGSDAPLIPASPWLGISSALDRSCADGRVRGAEQVISAAQALEMYTKNSSWLAYSENTRGRLSPGLAADWIEVDRNPVTSSAQEIRETRCLATFVGGKAVHEMLQ